ncbi:MAG: hypothetical protein LPK38_02305 [Actinomycetes bacterium]|nr:hypothetical protein [Actinomycetes bacterium]MDX5449852.1 hypothetical protein [Actinomycetes bacterium]
MATASRARPPWIDIAIQLVVGGMIIALLYAVVAGGAFTRAVDGFTGWYLGDVAPLYGAGTTAVVVTEPYESGFFQAHPEPPVGLTYDSVRFSSRLASAAGR